MGRPDNIAVKFNSLNIDKLYLWMDKNKMWNFFCREGGGGDFACMVYIIDLILF